MLMRTYFLRCDVLQVLEGHDVAQLGLNQALCSFPLGWPATTH